MVEVAREVAALGLPGQAGADAVDELARGPLGEGDGEDAVRRHAALQHRAS